MSEYSFASKSSLKLKGVDPTIKKKKKKKDKDKEREREEAKQALSTGEEAGEERVRYRKLTKAEMKFKQKKEENDKERIKQRATLNHKEKVEKFNSYLNTLSEHYDIPKVSWTK